MNRREFDAITTFNYWSGFITGILLFIIALFPFWYFLPALIIVSVGSTLFVSKRNKEWRPDE